jgi:hypothetical protein
LTGADHEDRRRSRSIGDVARNQRLKDNDSHALSATDMFEN